MEGNFLKKVSVTAISLLVLFGSSVNAATTGIVNTNGARIRSKASTDSTIITNVYENDKVEILETSGDWYKVSIDGESGYIKKDFIDTTSSNQTSTSNSNKTASNNAVNNSTINNNTVNKNTVNNTINNNTTSTYNTVSTNSVANTTIDNVSNEEGSKNLLVSSSEIKLRKLPSMTSLEHESFPAGTTFTKISEYSNWYNVSNGNISGWIPKVKLSNIANNTANNTTNNSSNVTTTNTTSNNTVNTSVENTTTTNTTSSNLTSNTTSTSSVVNKNAKITVETARVREKADSTSEIIGVLDLNDVITILAEEGSWYKFKNSEISGYISKSLVEIITDTKVSSRSLTEERKEDTTVASNEENSALTNALSNSSTIGADVVEYAKQFLGYSYVVGGKTPNTGFDCSGFTRYVYLNFGYSLGNTAASQNNLGTVIDRSQMQLGDLILFYDESNTKIGHTGIYIGNNEFIHAANPQRGVVIDNLSTNSYYSSRFVEARKII